MQEQEQHSLSRCAGGHAARVAGACSRCSGAKSATCSNCSALPMHAVVGFQPHASRMVVWLHACCRVTMEVCSAPLLELAFGSCSCSCNNATCCVPPACGVSVCLLAGHRLIFLFCCLRWPLLACLPAGTALGSKALLDDSSSIQRRCHCLSCSRTECCGATPLQCSSVDCGWRHPLSASCSAWCPL